MNSVTILYSGCAMEAPSQITTIPCSVARRNNFGQSVYVVAVNYDEIHIQRQTFLELVNLCVQIEIGIIIYKLISIFFAFGLGAVPSAQ